MTDFIPEAQALFTVVASVESRKPDIYTASYSLISQFLKRNNRTTEEYPLLLLRTLITHKI